MPLIRKIAIEYTSSNQYNYNDILQLLYSHSDIILLYLYAWGLETGGGAHLE